MRICTRTIRYFLIAAAVLCAAFLACSEPSYAAETGDVELSDGTVLEYWVGVQGYAYVTKVTLGEGVTELELPNKLGNNRTQGIRYGAFDGCGALKTLYIPETVSNIKDDALLGCTGLERFLVADGNAEYYSKDGVLFRKPNQLFWYPPEKKDSYYMVPPATGSIFHMNSPYLETLEYPRLGESSVPKGENPNLKTLIIGRGVDDCWLPNVERLVIGDPVENVPAHMCLLGQDAVIVSGAGTDTEAWAVENGFAFETLPYYPITRTDGASGNEITKNVADSPFSIPVTCEKSLVYQSEKEDVATIDEDGTITIHGVGKTCIHVYSPYDGIRLPAYYEFLVKVEKSKATNTITADPARIVVDAGTENVRLNVTSAYPEIELQYASSDETRLTVDQNGLVTLLTREPGTYKVYVFSSETNEVAANMITVPITIQEKSSGSDDSVTPSAPTGPSTPSAPSGSDKSSASAAKISPKLKVTKPKKGVLGKKIRLKASAKTKVTYQSLTPKIARVNSKGVITLKHPGIVKIRVKAAGNSKYFRESRKVKFSCGLARPKLKSKKKGRTAKITWSKVSGAQKYYLYVKFPGSSKYVLAVKKNAKVKGVLHRNLKKGKKYSYKVRAYCKYKGKKYFSPYSKPVTITVK